MRLKDYGLLTNQVLTLLAGEFVLRLIRDKSERRKLHEECDKIWLSVDRKQLYRILDRLHLKGYLSSQKDKAGLEEISLSSSGKSHTLQISFRNLKLQKRPRKWDKRWRIVLFDIPELKKKIRDALRQKLKTLGFIEFQKSVFVYPYSCREEINFIINFFGIPNHVFYIEAEISSDHRLRAHFKL